MPHYDFTCDSCGHNEPDYWMSMKNYRRIDCPSCGAKMRQVFHPPMIGGDLPTRGNFNYFDPNLGVQITSKRQREDEMKRQGLREFVPTSEHQKVLDEASYVAKHGGGKVPVSKEMSKQKKKETDAYADRAIDQAIRDAGCL